VKKGGVMSGKLECICWSLAADPYRCRACWPEGGSERERALFRDEIARARKEVEDDEKRRK
jgi:hypothetical protein